MRVHIHSMSFHGDITTGFVPDWVLMTIHLTPGWIRGTGGVTSTPVRDAMLYMAGVGAVNRH